MVKNLPANAGDTGDEDSIPGSGRSPGGGHSNPLQYPCLENLMDLRPWDSPGKSTGVGCHCLLLEILLMDHKEAEAQRVKVK